MHRSIVVLPVILLLFGCPNTAVEDAGKKKADAALPFDANQGDRDFRADAAGLDRYWPYDTMVVPPDGGVPVDAISMDTTGTDTTGVDAAVDGSVVADAASPDTAGDAGPPQGDNIIANGSFELWTDGVPDFWLGAESNISDEFVTEWVGAAHDGDRVCQLENDRGSHKRFTTQPFSIEPGYYNCSYWVRGAGEIRNARYDGSYSSYTGYTTVDSDIWQQILYHFHLAEPVADVFELIFSLRYTNSGRNHLHIDDVVCTRNVEPCDSVSCEAWQVCNNDTAACETASGFCEDALDCSEWQECAGDHTCATAAGRCTRTEDCDGATPVCDLPSHTCVAGDPCADVTCDEWRECNPSDASCVLSEGRCINVEDCTQALPVCNVVNHTCEAVDSAANVVPNGGFEQWEDVYLGNSSPTTYHLPVSWFGTCDSCSYPTSEIDPNDVDAYTTSVHGGSTACQLTKSGQPADRFTSEPFTVTAAATYTCAYWVRGKGTHRQRSYCGQWAPNTDYLPVDSDQWQQVTFDMSGSSSQCVLVFYPSNTESERDHVQIDDVVCSRKHP